MEIGKSFLFGILEDLCFSISFSCKVVLDLQGRFGEGAIVGETPISLLQIDFNSGGFFIAHFRIIYIFLEFLSRFLFLAYGSIITFGLIGFAGEGCIGHLESIAISLGKQRDHLQFSGLGISSPYLMFTSISRCVLHIFYFLGSIPIVTTKPSFL